MPTFRDLRPQIPDFASVQPGTLRILLTGASGFLGSALLPQLLDRGHTVRALYRSTLPDQVPPGVEALQGDLQDEALCHSLCQDIDAVIHLAAHAHVRSSAQDQRRNTFDATCTLAAAAAATQVQNFVYISSSKARFPTHSPYAAAKLAAEQHLLALHARGTLPVICLRPSLVFGPGMRGNLATLLRLLQRPYLPLFPAAAQPMGMIAREDCCAAIALALQHPALQGHTWELHDGQHYTLDALVRSTRAHLQLPPPDLALPRVCVKWAANLASLSAPLTGLALGMGTYRALYEEPYTFDTAFCEHTGYCPQQSFQSQLPTLMESLA